MSSDAELVEAARRGDAASLGLLLERYRAPLYGLSLRILGHGSEARDAVHDTFLIALRRIDELREPSAVGGWLHAVLRNARRMRLRADQGELPSGSRLATSPGAPPSCPPKGTSTSWLYARGSSAEAEKREARPASSVSRSLFEVPAPTRGDGIGCADERCMPVYSSA